MLKLYAYQGCSTCRNAMKWLKANHVPLEEIAIRETPPTISELNTMLKARDGDLRSLFNTSGQDYRAMGLKNTLPTMKTSEALKLLSQHGNLVKRPFAIDQKNGIYLVGFKEPEWNATLNPFHFSLPP